MTPKRVVPLVPVREERPGQKLLSDRTEKQLRAFAGALHAVGHELLDPIVFAGNTIDNCRAELVCAGLGSPADVLLFLDDDVELVQPNAIVQMVEADLDVLAAPYINRNSRGFFIVPISGIERRGELRVVEAATATIGATLIARQVFERMYGHFEDLRYDAIRTPGGQACAVFQPGVMSAKLLGDVLSPARVYCGEDKMFCVRAHEAGFKLHAAIDVVTDHRALRGCLADELIASGLTL